MASSRMTLRVPLRRIQGLIGVSGLRVYGSGFNRDLGFRVY